MIYPKKIDFNFCLETIAATFTTLVITTKTYIFSFQYYIHHALTMEKNKRLFYLLLLRSLCHDSDKKNIVSLLLLRSLRHDYHQKKLFFIPTLISLHNYHEDKILFCFSYYVYAMITTKNKYCSILYMKQ